MENKATGVLLICNPADVYRKLPEIDAAKAYEKFAFEDYDKFVSFKPEYDPSKPTLEQIVLIKGGRPLVETVFANQPISKIGDVKGEFTTSCYLFNPKSAVKDVKSLPDLDVIELTGEDVSDGATALKEFYEMAGWTVGLFYGHIKKVALHSQHDIPLPDVFALFRLAKQFGYNTKELCFVAGKYNMRKLHR